MLKGWDLLSDEGRASLCQRDECRLALAVGFGISPVLSDEQWLAALKTKPQTLLEAMLRIKRSAAVIFPVPPPRTLEDAKEKAAVDTVVTAAESPTSAN
jgi:hypothetical protein